MSELMQFYLAMGIGGISSIAGLVIGFIKSKRNPQADINAGVGLAYGLWIGFLTAALVAVAI